MPQVHSSAAQNLSSNFDTLHHARAVKSPTVEFFEDTKHIVAGLFNSPTTKIIADFPLEVPIANMF